MNPAYKAVGMVGSTKDGKFSMNGCAVAIAPGWAIGVAHVGGDTFVQDGKQIKIEKKIIHKTASGEPADLALYKLASPAPITTTILWSPFEGKLKGATVYLVGYGQTARPRADGLGWEPDRGSFGVLRVATNRLDAGDTMRHNIGSVATPRYKSTKAVAYDIDKSGDARFSTLGGSATEFEGGVGAKDSGGGWFVDVGGKKLLVALSMAVAAPSGRGIPNAYGFGGLGIGAHLQAYKDWIQKTTGLKL